MQYTEEAGHSLRITKLVKGYLQMIAYIKYVAPVCVRDIRYPDDVRYLERSSTYHLVASQ